ncbi:tRNA-modifying protein YgfZ [Arsenophonus endosymbiont of Aleurodicus dispersus]|uniref:tRNA-modifying protein YgfZ n=1 Tax=Arsenophonus endosymbiont of Aleurodicus dispersus TaxID=235559 RepID=UPI000EB41400|nr:tRNA-modifying protein YgfZ [Arsenophonus endosymbiont of Aleurodicus dispersus]VAY02346.1 tRNA-modifying protein YgfZ [Arsenophonus endosymbiont of Aleurodicus dispersus]
MTILNKFTQVTDKIYHQLPLTLMLLNDWSFITVAGVDAKKYLHSQLTADITKLNAQQHIFTAHCDAKGKIWSTLRLFHYNEGFGYILRTSVAAKQLNALKKYAVFSQITLSQQNNIMLLGVTGQGARDALNNKFPLLADQKNPVIYLGQMIVLHFSLPLERFLIVTDSETVAELTNYFHQHDNSQQWLALDIAAGLANIDIENSNQFLPQAVNLQALPASISFQKGCYIGQEMVARAKYRGANKLAMFWLAGAANTLPKNGEAIEWKIGNNWRRTGTVLAAANLTKGFISLQVVMNNNITKDSIFRLASETNSKLMIQPLPYLLTDQ